MNKKKQKNELLVVALGGNALLRHGESGTFDEQRKNIEETSRHLAELVERGYRLIITHGNGPQIGATLLRHEAGLKVFNVPPLPMFVGVAETQASIGSIIQQALRSELKRRGLDRVIVTIITRMIVDRDDPELKRPSKPVGSFMSKEQLEQARARHPNYSFVEDKARGGWRRLVPSPDPIRIAIAEQESIQTLVDDGFIVVACGGGGIPTIEENGWRAVGIEAVIDKDLAAERLATSTGASKLVILTDVDGVYLHYGKPNQKKLGSLGVDEAKRLLAKKELGEGTMHPKVLAAVRFVENGGREAIIAELSAIGNALEGKAGTHIRKS